MGETAEGILAGRAARPRIVDASEARLAALREELETDPLCADTWAAIGAEHASRGETGSAVAAFQKTLAFGPAHASALEGLIALGVEPAGDSAKRFTVLTVRPREYAHAGAFDELAEALHFGLLGLGLDCRMRSVLDGGGAGRTHIVVGGHLLERAGMEVPEGSILFNSEQIHDGCPWLTPSYLELLRRHAVWDYSATNVARLRELGVRRATCVPLGHVEELRRIAMAEVEDIDVVFAGSVSDRRARIIEALTARGLRVKDLFGVYGRVRDAWVARARIALNLRFYDDGPFEIVRVSYLLSNGRFVVSETPSRPEDQRPLDGGVVFATYDRLVDTCVEYAAQPEKRRLVAARGLELMRQRPMRDVLRCALHDAVADDVTAAPDEPPTVPRRGASGQPTVAALCCLYDDLRWLEASIGSAYNECDRIYFVVSERPWSGPPRDLGATFAAIAALPDPDGKIQIIRGSWQSEADQRNAGLDAMIEAGFDYCFVLDGDEIYDPSDLRKMKRTVFSAPDINAWHMSWHTYWKSERFRIEPPEPFKPLVFVRLGTTRFEFARDVASTTRALIDARVGICHHMSYARTNEEVRLKLSSFSHAHEIVDRWYEEVWLRWDEDPELTNLHPTHPHCYARAIEQPREMLPQYSGRGPGREPRPSRTRARRHEPLRCGRASRDARDEVLGVRLAAHAHDAVPSRADRAERAPVRPEAPLHQQRAGHGARSPSRGATRRRRCPHRLPHRRRPREGGAGFLRSLEGSARPWVCLLHRGARQRLPLQDPLPPSLRRRFDPGGRRRLDRRRP